MIAQALRNFGASAGKHLSLVIVNAHCQPWDNGCSSAIHKQKFRVSSFKFRRRKPHLAFGAWHLPEAPACLMFLDSCGGESNPVCQLETGDWKLLLSPADKMNNLQPIAVSERSLGPLRTRDDLAVEFDCDAVAFHAEALDQLR